MAAFSNVTLNLAKELSSGFKYPLHRHLPQSQARRRAYRKVPSAITYSSVFICIHLCSSVFICGQFSQIHFSDRFLTKLPAAHKIHFSLTKLVLGVSVEEISC